MTQQFSKNPPPVEIGSSQWTRPFWDAARQQKLVAPRCVACGTFRMPPTPFCPRCRSQEIDWVTLSGRGLVYSYTVVVKAILPGMEDCIPYMPAVIELPDASGVRLISNIVDADPAHIRIGQTVQVVWHTLPDGEVVPRFKCCAAQEDMT